MQLNYERKIPLKHHDLSSSVFNNTTPDSCSVVPDSCFVERSA